MAKRIYSETARNATNAELLSVKNFILTKPIKVSRIEKIGSNFLFDGVAILICLNGTSTVKVNYREFEVRKNQILVIMPYQIVSTVNIDEEAFMAGLFIGGDYLVDVPVVNHDFDRAVKIGANPVITLTDKQMENLMELHSVILARYKNLHAPYSPELLKALMFAFLAELGSIALIKEREDSMVHHQPTRKERITNDFFKLLIQNFRENRAVAYYADKLCYTPKYLSTVVKSVTGHTIQDWINEIVIMHIKNQLRTTEKTVLEISEEMNFSNPSFFGRFFKQYTGMTPLQFRFR